MSEELLLNRANKQSEILRDRINELEVELNAFRGIEKLLNLSNSKANKYAEMCSRLRIVDMAITRLRDRDIPQKDNRLYAYGVRGCLEYIEDGEIDHIRDNLIRQEAKKLIDLELYGVE